MTSSTRLLSINSVTELTFCLAVSHSPEGPSAARCALCFGCMHVHARVSVSAHEPARASRLMLTPRGKREEQRKHWPVENKSQQKAFTIITLVLSDLIFQFPLTLNVFFFLPFFCEPVIIHNASSGTAENNTRYFHFCLRCVCFVQKSLHLCMTGSISISTVKGRQWVFMTDS